MKDRDYSDLEGRVITIIDDMKRERKAVVAGCDYDIGITIADSEDNDRILYCLRGPSAPNFVSYHNATQHHNCKFFYMVRSIKKGLINLTHSANISNKIGMCSGGGYESKETCPFSR